jgi:hypothetical protein
VITSFTSVCPLRPGVAPEVRRLLERLPVGERSPFAVNGLAHFARLQVIGHVHDGPQLRPPVLVLSADVDEPARPWLSRVLGSSRDRMGDVLDRCEGAPTDRSAGDYLGRAVEYLLDHDVQIGLRFVNTEGPTAAELRAALDQRARLAGFAQGYRDAGAAELRTAFLDEFGLAPSPDAAATAGR